MSRHRTEITELADSISRKTKTIVDDDVAQALVSSGSTVFRIVLFSSDVSASPALAQLKSEAEDLIRLAQPVDFRDAEIAVHLAPRERIGRCVSGSSVTARRFNLVDVRIKVTVRTRWLNPISEAEFSRQWVVA
jgi:hypothetical protein